MHKAVIAAMMAASSDVDLMSCDRLEAMAKGHGMLNLALFGIGNVIIEEIQKGTDIRLRNSNTKTLPLDDVLLKTIDVAQKAGADAANAALLSAVMLYFAGSGAQCGVNVGSRKIGAMARMAAKVDRCGVAAIPTPKWGNKISGFPAVQSIYQAMMKGELTQVDGRNIPNGIGALFIGHGTLGEEILFPQLGKESARVGTEAMLKAFAGAGMRPDPLVAALFGAAATLEIIHPDAFVPQPDGYSVNSPYVVGKYSCEAAGLPPEMHLHLTNETYETARLISDLALILKDSGGATIPGMITFRDLLGVFLEPISPFRLTAPPLGHISAEVLLAMKALLTWDFDENRVCEAIVSLENEKRVDPEMSLIGVNTVARAAEQLRKGPVSKVLVKASDPARIKGLYSRAVKAYEGLSEGKTVVEMARELDQERKESVERKCSEILSKSLGKDVCVEVVCLGALGRKKEKWGRFWVMDTGADVEVTVDGQRTLLKGLVNEIIPAAVLNSDHGLRELLFPACLPLWEFSLAGHTIINATIPAAVAAVMGKVDPAEAAIQAEKGAFITSGVPGVKMRAKEVASRALLIGKALD
jgi:hypothetical protein